ncbi:arsenate reductase-like glutaredoxin family protein [Ruminiclostridium sufflavum DSM 19573]|uniref:Arsenate reductase-like glutaredoxin family protein n=1 Tax=Ruminiclostridium sufflavum DSM 19573 TaxID=1121337 RepID=A0A318Y311_9FIRM|nr:ArsC/Spx/MgsR family protein [Ruminiclostridium sufflavum]PYG85856.1 arsenate reductase-like glutaredoxin family protein [Ruminiclostridium sufflavum DSM 19573]
MNIQIYGAKGFDTQKTERYFKERKISYQYIDLFKYGLSKGEYENVRAAVGIRELINVSSKDYERLNMRNLGIGKVAEEVLLKNPKLFNSPIVRNGKKATVGYKPEIWEQWD